jgi:rare lipoprotein A
MPHLLTIVSIVLSSSLLIGCASKPHHTASTSNTQTSNGGYVEIDPDAIPDPVPRHEPKSKYGNPKSYHVLGKTYYVEDTSHGFREKGLASWYGHPFHGRRTSSGEQYDMYQMTAAHKTVPIPCYMSVTNLDNGRSIIVRVNDRGPFHKGRVIDLSYAAAKKLGVHASGTAPVEIAVVSPREAQQPPRHSRPPLMTAQATPKQAANPKVTPSEEPAYLQVAAFNSKPRAQEMAAHLQQLPEAPGIQIESGYTNNLPVHRVRVGPFKSPTFAEQFTAYVSRLYPDVSPVVITR